MVLEPQRVAATPLVQAIPIPTVLQSLKPRFENKGSLNIRDTSRESPIEHDDWADWRYSHSNIWVNIKYQPVDKSGKDIPLDGPIAANAYSLFIMQDLRQYCGMTVRRLTKFNRGIFLCNGIINPFFIHLLWFDDCLLEMFSAHVKIAKDVYLRLIIGWSGGATNGHAAFRRR